MKRQIRSRRPVEPPAQSEGQPTPVLRLAAAGTEGATVRRLPRLHRGDKPPARGLLVEFVRLIMVTIFAVAGWEVAVSLGPRDTSRLLIGIVVGSGVGYVLGGMFGRSTASAVSQVEREFRRVPAAELLSGSIGLMLGLGLATLASLPMFHLPPVSAYPAIAFLYATLGYLGYKVGRSKTEELFGLFGVKPRAAGIKPGEVSLLDTSAILDGRIMPLVQLGFLGGTLLLTPSVLEEVQRVADSSNPNRRTRGRRALDLLIALKRDPSVDVVLIEDEERKPGEEVDSQLVRLARARGSALITNDAGLAKLAAAMDVSVRSIHALAEALRPPVVPGERVLVKLTRRGTDAGQAVGYLEDGTMVVVEEADHLLGDTVSVAVRNSIQTATGQMVFGEVAGTRQED